MWFHNSYNSGANPALLEKLAKHYQETGECPQTGESESIRAIRWTCLEYTLKATSVEASNVRSSARLVPETERTKALKDFMVKQCIAEMNNKMERLGTQTVSFPSASNSSASTTLPKQKKMRKMTEEEKAARRERKRLEKTAPL